MSNAKKKSLDLPKHLLWEYDLTTFDYIKSWFIVIERIIERGDIIQWRLVQDFYGKHKMLEVANTSRQLSERDKAFTRLYVNSPLNDPHRRTDYQAGNLPTPHRVAKRRIT